MKKELMMSMAIAATTAMVSCNNGGKTAANASDSVTTAPVIKEEAVTYSTDTTTMNGYVYYNENQTGVRPAVLVVPEWWGLNEYPRTRAKKLAEMGYIAMAVDMYGNGKVVDNPQDAQAAATPFYLNPALTIARLGAAEARLKTMSQTDTSNIAAIGYCFGGYVVLNSAKLGADLKGVVSFHGNLTGAPVNKDLLKAQVLVCHGEADQFVPAAEVAAFKKSMDSVNANYLFKSYANATHAFTNPASTKTGKKFSLPLAYNAAADSASWADMNVFFGKIFPATK